MDQIDLANLPAALLPGLRLSGAPQGAVLAVAGVLALLAVAALAVVGAKVGRFALRMARISKLDRRYPGARRALPRRYTIRRNGNHRTDCYELAFPHWEHAASDGAADRRFADNRVVWPACTVRVGPLEIACHDPAATVRFVGLLRAKGAPIAPCGLEVEKGQRLVQDARDRQTLTTVEALVERFEPHPADFERFCAHIFQRLGYRAELTPPSNDGGYDVMLYRNGDNAAPLALVECKCFAPSHHVGRPLVQKLVGANRTVGAEKLIFVTSSGYTAGAVAYASEAGVELVDGARLLWLRDRAFGTSARPVGFDDVPWQLTEADIAPYYPPDFV